MAKMCQKTIFQQIGEKDTDLRSITKTKKGMKLSAYMKSTSYKLVISQSKEHLSKLVVSNEVKNFAFKKSQEKAKPKRQNTTENADVLPQKNNPKQLFSSFMSDLSLVGSSKEIVHSRQDHRIQVVI